MLLFRLNLFLWTRLLGHVKCIFTFLCEFCIVLWHKWTIFLFCSCNAADWTELLTTRRAPIRMMCPLVAASPTSSTRVAPLSIPSKLDATMPSPNSSSSTAFLSLELLELLSAFRWAAVFDSLLFNKFGNAFFFYSIPNAHTLDVYWSKNDCAPPNDGLTFE